jgi:hypothetical protein
MRSFVSWLWSKLRRRQTPEPDEGAYSHFFALGIQYYVSARFSAMAKLLPVSGNLYHHAVEMLMKGQLSRTLPLETLKRKYSHGLKRTWKQFKKLFQAEDLSPFDSLICALDRFERLRYPDNFLKEGMSAMLAWDPPKTPTKISGSAAKVPHYEFAVTDLDRLIDRMFRLCSMNPSFYMADLDEHGMKVLENDNPAWQNWFPNRARGAANAS